PKPLTRLSTAHSHFGPRTLSAGRLARSAHTPAFAASSATTDAMTVALPAGLNDFHSASLADRESLTSIFFALMPPTLRRNRRSTRVFGEPGRVRPSPAAPVRARPDFPRHNGPMQSDAATVDQYLAELDDDR